MRPITDFTTVLNLPQRFALNLATKGVGEGEVFRKIFECNSTHFSFEVALWEQDMNMRANFKFSFCKKVSHILTTEMQDIFNKT